MVRLRLQAGSALVDIDPEHGGRLATIVVDGHPLLFSGGSLALQWGAYPMVPWAGRVADGRFRFGGETVDLPRNLPPHSAHGVGFSSPWSVVSQGPTEAELQLDLQAPWPFGGRVDQRFRLSERALSVEMTVTAEVDMPVMVGWHPWFNRFLGGPDGRPVEARIGLPGGSMYELDGRAIPTGRLVAPPPPPFDNCFTGLAGGPTVTWPGLVELRLTSSCDHWVVYDQPGHAVCVEPQSGPPDEFNGSPRVLAGGDRLEAWFHLRWD